MSKTTTMRGSSPPCGRETGQPAHMTGWPGEAEDLATGVFVRMIRAIKNGRPIGH